MTYLLLTYLTLIYDVILSEIFIYLDLVQSEWTQNEQTGQKVRNLSFTIALSQAIGPRTSHISETQVVIFIKLLAIIYIYINYKVLLYLLMPY